MKVKNAFISNSSVSSFTCIGLHNANERLGEYCHNNDLYEISEKTNDLWNAYSEDWDAIGISIPNIFRKCGDMKVNDVKQYLVDELNKIYKTNFKVTNLEFIEEAEYDG